MRPLAWAEGTVRVKVQVRRGLKCETGPFFRFSVHLPMGGCCYSSSYTFPSVDSSCSALTYVSSPPSKPGPSSSQRRSRNCCSDSPGRRRKRSAFPFVSSSSSSHPSCPPSVAEWPRRSKTIGLESRVVGLIGLGCSDGIRRFLPKPG